VDALAAYELDKFAASSRAPRASWQRTWLDYYAKAVRTNPSLAGKPAFPISAEGLATVAALMKMDNHRAFGNYLSWAKSEHIKLGFEWTQLLDQEAKQAMRSVSRGLGEARQSASFDLPRLAQRSGFEPTCIPGHPVFPADLAVIGSMWILREIEAVWSTVDDIQLDKTALCASWTLSASKTDPNAKACTRSWGCLCAVGPASVCPYHCVLGYIEKLKTFFRDKGMHVDSDSPLFPDFNLKVPLKNCVVTALERVLSAAGETIVDSAGRRRYGGHSLRVTGSRYWTGLGLEVFKVQIFARWGSNIILRYVSDIPIANVTGDLTGNPVARSCLTRRPVEQLLEEHILRAQQQIDSLKAEVARLGDSMNPSFVQNLTSKAWHKVLISGDMAPPALWRTCCGWPFGRANFKLRSKGPRQGQNICDTCFPLEHLDPPSDASSH